MLLFCRTDLPLPPLIASVFAVDFYVVGKSPVRSIILHIAENRRIFGSVQRVTTTDVRIRAVAMNRADMEGFVGQIKLSFPPHFLRDAAAPPDIPSDPVVALSHDPEHIVPSWAALCRSTPNSMHAARPYRKMMWTLPCTARVRQAMAWAPAWRLGAQRRETSSRSRKSWSPRYVALRPYFRTRAAEWALPALQPMLPSFLN